jgi:glycosyltransferase involved in cell wall biosynthesis
MLSQITPVILTYNEAANIERSLRQLIWASDIVLVDGGSTDETVQLARQFPQVRIFEREFDTHQQQWTYGLKNTGIKSPWVLALDADYLLTDELIQELRDLQPSSNVGGYAASFVYCCHGKRLRSGVYPPVTVLYRCEDATYEQDGHTQRVRVRGQVRRLSSTILHDDRKSLGRWLNSQSRYGELDAEKLLTAESSSLSPVDRMRQWVIVAPSVMMFYCLFVRGGILDGWSGLHYALERTVAEMILSLNLIRFRLLRQEQKVDSRADHNTKLEISPNSKFKVQSTKF